MANNGTAQGSKRELIASIPLGNDEPQSAQPATHADWVRAALVRFEGPLLRYAMRVAGDLETARDVVQETFLKLCKEDRANVEGHLSQWLFTVCRNRALDIQRKERRMSTTVDLDQRTSLQQGSPHEELAQRETTHKVLSLLPRLPNNQQEVIRLKFQNELSYREIADVTGLSVTNVGFLLHVGIKRLRELLKADGAYEPLTH